MMRVWSGLSCSRAGSLSTTIAITLDLNVRLAMLWSHLSPDGQKGGSGSRSRISSLGR